MMAVLRTSEGSFAIIKDDVHMVLSPDEAEYVMEHISAELLNDIVVAEQLAEE